MIPEWKKIADHGNMFGDGDHYLCALRVTNNKTKKTEWEFHKIVSRIDEEAEQVDFYHDDEHGEYFSDWRFEDFEFYIKYGEH